MKYWVTLSAADLSDVFNADELDAVTRGEYLPYAENALADVTAQVREAVATNRANRLDPAADTIPRSLRAAALDIVALRLLKRFALSVTDERKKAADDAAAVLDAVRRAERPVLDVNGVLPAAPGQMPAIVAPAPAYGNNGVGWWPTP